MSNVLSHKKAFSKLGPLLWIEILWYVQYLHGVTQGRVGLSADPDQEIATDAVMNYANGV